MKKVLLAVALCITTMFSANAQIKIGANLGLQFPLGNYGDLMKTGFGGDINGEYLITDNIGLGIGIGLYSFGAEFGSDTKFHLTPITLNGYYYFMTEGLKPYVGLNLGAYILGSNVEESNSETNFGFAPVVGLQYDFNDNFALNANLKYNYILQENDMDNLSAFGINVGVVYTIN